MAGHNDDVVPFVLIAIRISSSLGSLDHGSLVMFMASLATSARVAHELSLLLT